MKNNIVLFCGDVAATDGSREAFRAADVDTLFTDVSSVMAEADNIIVNLEGPLTERETKIRKIGPNLKTPVQGADVLKKLGVTACGLANNHIGDYDGGGLKDTFDHLDRVGIGYFGAGANEEAACAPYFFMAGDKNIAMLAVNEREYTVAYPDRPGAAPFYDLDTCVRIAETKAQADYLVVMYHGGKEQCEYPSPRLRKACHAFCKLGADLVLCQHSHIIGTKEQVGDSTILYGQGNFHFVGFLNHLPGWTTGLMVKAVFGEKMDLEFIPVEALEHGIRLMKGEEAEQILSGLEERSKRLQDGTWIDGWREFCLSKKEFYEKTVFDVGHAEGLDFAREYFAIHLDCDCHADVWRELFPTWHGAGVDGSWKDAKFRFI